MPTLDTSDGGDIVVGGENLSGAAAAVVEKARKDLNKWIDGKFKELSEKTRTELEQSSAMLQTNLDAIDKALDESQAALAGLADDIKKLVRMTLHSDELSAAANKLAERTATVQKDLDDRRKMFQGAGKTAGSALVKAIKTLVT